MSLNPTSKTVIIALICMVVARISVGCACSASVSSSNISLDTVYACHRINIYDIEEVRVLLAEARRDVGFCGGYQVRGLELNGVVRELTLVDVDFDAKRQVAIQFFWLNNRWWSCMVVCDLSDVEKSMKEIVHEGLKADCYSNFRSSMALQEKLIVFKGKISAGDYEEISSGLDDGASAVIVNSFDRG